MRLLSWRFSFPSRPPLYQRLDLEDGTEPAKTPALHKRSCSIISLLGSLLASVVLLILILLRIDTRWTYRLSPSSSSETTSQLAASQRLADALPSFLTSSPNFASRQWAPASLNTCPPGTPSYLAPCLAQRREGAVYGEELIYPDFRLHEPLFAPSRADGDRPEWRRKLDGIMERASFCKDKRWVCYRGQTGQNVVLANATFKGNPPADLWVDDACMSDGVTTAGLATAPADAAINTLATQAEYDAAFPVDTLLIATTPDSWSFQHFLDRITHIVAQGHHFTFGESAPEVVAGRPPGGAVSEMYDMLGLGGGKVHFRSPRVAAKKVVFSCRSPLVHPWLSLRSLEMFGLDPAGIPIDRRKKVVYISRSHGSTSNSGRRVRNEDQMLEGVRALLAMRDQGEELVLFHELGISSQPQIMAWFHENVRAVIGPHGGGLYHHRWTGRDTLLLELMPRSWTSHMFWEEAGMLGQTYANILLEPVREKSTDMEADIPAVLEILSAQLGKPDARGVGLERLYRWHAPELLADEQ
ncbi:uncharacterized protein TRAVEDRAFT_58667 [Trametes versicolor FP-101664 SS1]|uniref:uncharacterized protein n=1 Tax=Trametes versicolor (strain FP-101664) TaxID=717944 RepID=UPI0004623B5E|nr:uncharacterized protein TRAVEDRAFT_58667 [Trametes versicolor FP-101664 SS1]EIW58394.1 hypothetical protein TRAVEDRAFT_58667 [Trametes versicolor FP-101664 SS1]